MMKLTADATIKQLKAYVAELERVNAELNAKVHWLEERFRLAMKKRYGASSERSHPDQLSLIFDEAEVIAKPDEPEPTFATITYERRENNGAIEKRSLKTCRWNGLSTNSPKKNGFVKRATATCTA